MNQEHLAYLSQPLGEYVHSHREAHKHMKNGRSTSPVFSLEQLLSMHQKRIYKGVHEFCTAKELYDEVITCVIFKSDQPNPIYFHTLYFGPETQNPTVVHDQICHALNISEETFQASHLCCQNPTLAKQTKKLWTPFQDLDKLL